MFECLCFANGCRQRRGNHDADAWYCREQTSVSILFRIAPELIVEDRDAAVQRFPLLPHVIDQEPHSNTQGGYLAFVQQFNQEQFELPSTLRSNNPALQ